jgi:hypothetical protein
VTRGGRDRSDHYSVESEYRGSLWNPFVERLLRQEPPLGVEAWRLAMALARNVFGYNRTEAPLGEDLIRRESRLHGRSVERARNDLLARGLLEIELGRPGPGGRTLWRPLREPPGSGEPSNPTATPAPTTANTPAQIPAEASAPERARSLEVVEDIPTIASVEELDHLALTPAQRAEAERQPPELIQQWVEASRSDSVVNPEGFFLAGIRSGRSPFRDPYELAHEHINTHGWPTGSRWVHGTHSGAYIQDPLGADRPTYSVPWGRPTIEAIQAALEADGGGRAPRADSEDPRA